MSKVTAYVATVVALAAVAVLILYSASPAFDIELARAALVFAGLGFLAQILSYSVGGGVSAASSFLPFLTAAVLAPTWVGCAAVCGTTLASGLIMKGPTTKTLFNASQITLATAVAILAYRALGGQPLISGTRYVPAYLALVLTFTTINSLAVSGVIALSERRNIA